MSPRCPADVTKHQQDPRPRRPRADASTRLRQPFHRPQTRRPALCLSLLFPSSSPPSTPHHTPHAPSRRAVAPPASSSPLPAGRHAGPALVHYASIIHSA
ncbi:hypothetical protein PICMEDRAFT_89740 [Pichia membranifaciens NRRL Y-2026]|uniref:Uncharacterized protein n=1 Tax=Pichia membranifaciens NRRL Y-2026 TaxID=763406 RepID=A0A1E3NS77_9ASCO|nr:hypothetical protein PICMEDRAFT_89740 [Pichia membranifaciens NRRL Y-2026]ODQ48975.1 hypothetical protein PICMEDRAFT_89740 [Pichia membranifaciens NRRL Y-2026]